MALFIDGFSKKRFTILVATLALGLSAAGCVGESKEADGADCASLCEEAQDCPDAEPTTNCSADCQDAIEQAESIGCGAEYDDLLDCVADEPDICDLTDACGAEVQSYIQCMDDSCNDDPSTCPVE